MSSSSKQFVSGVAYTAVAKYAGQFVQLGITAVISRIVAPEAFGVILTCTVLINFFAIFSEMGLGPAIIQHKDLKQGDMDNFFSFSFWTGLILSALFILFSPYIARYYQEPIMVKMCLIMAGALFFNSVNVVPNGLMYRDKRFRFIAIRTLIVQVATGAIAILAAYRLPEEMKIYALVVQPVVSAAAIFVVNFAAYPARLRFSFGISSVRKVLGYSAYQFLFSVINYFSRNLDKLIIGKYLDMAEAGYYEKSYKLMLLPLQNLTSVLTPVMHPIFSEMQDDKARLLGGYMKVVRLLAFVGFPASVLMFFGGRELMLLIFGDMWEPSVAAFKILAFSIGIQMILSSSGSIFQAAGDTRTLFICGLTSAIINVAGMLVAIVLYRTIEAVALGIVITFTINFVIAYILMFRVTFKAPSWIFWRELISPLGVSLIAAAVLAVVNMILPAEMNMFLSLGIKCAVFGVIWLGYIQLTGVLDIIGQTKNIITKLKR